MWEGPRHLPTLNLRWLYAMMAGIVARRSDIRGLRKAKVLE